MNCNHYSQQSASKISNSTTNLKLQELKRGMGIHSETFTLKLVRMKFSTTMIKMWAWCKSIYRNKKMSHGEATFSHEQNTFKGVAPYPYVLQQCTQGLQRKLQCTDMAQHFCMCWPWLHCTTNSCFCIFIPSLHLNHFFKKLESENVLALSM